MPMPTLNPLEVALSGFEVTAADETLLLGAATDNVDGKFEALCTAALLAAEVSIVIARAGARTVDA